MYISKPKPRNFQSKNPKSGEMAERSKAVDSSSFANCITTFLAVTQDLQHSTHENGVGSNPTLVRVSFFFLPFLFMLSLPFYKKGFFFRCSDWQSITYLINILVCIVPDGI